jgi:hypothetical protein
MHWPFIHVGTLLKKGFNDFSVPSRDATNQNLPDLTGTAMQRLAIVTSRLGTGKSLTFFYIVGHVLFMSVFYYSPEPIVFDCSLP